MQLSKTFAAAPQDVADLVQAHPFALLVSQGGDRMQATPLPLLLCTDEEGDYLLGHFARANPHCTELQQRPEALAVFLGPHAYISPSWFADRTQAPTWNYATVHYRVRVRFLPGLDAARQAVEALSLAMETGRPAAWATKDMGPRLEKLLPAICAFRADIVSADVKFKLGQNERLAELNSALTALEQAGQQPLAALMRKANGARLAPPLAIEAASGEFEHVRA